jgi:hypothetical protein
LQKQIKFTVSIEAFETTLLNPSPPPFACLRQEKDVNGRRILSPFSKGMQGDEATFFKWVRDSNLSKFQ